MSTKKDEQAEEVLLGGPFDGLTTLVYKDAKWLELCGRDWMAVIYVRNPEGRLVYSPDGVKK